ncbi:hypothetical protein AS026_19485 [Rhizobium altiplani]|uniref:Uncharacterized protein n=1 Tax=Rhizobium altiplani TaxID=1864509 RepID=A0A109J7P5_9HYPH|nr:hypothetical protein [Rhizobium altiplani]KWV43854.1 hypothetical protein AS026_19485 [Rhizobium altiplani]
MGIAKDYMMEPESIDVGFECPTPQCDEIVEASVEPAYYDTSAENESDMAGYSSTRITCLGCKREYIVEGHNYGAGMTYSVVNYPSIEVDVY